MGNSNIVEQTRALTVISRLICKNRIPHAVLLTGKEGIGKGAFALEIAKILLCNARSDDGRSCGICASCRKADLLIHPDLLVIRPDRNIIRIDQVRAIIEETTYRVRKGHFRVVIIEDADRLGDEASNALLKVIEEPPEGNLFLLTSSRYYQILPTIRSRCCRIVLQPVSTAELLKTVEEKSTLSEEEALYYALLADGSRSKLVELLDGEGFSLWESISSQVEKFGRISMGQFFGEVGGWLEAYGGDMEALLRRLKIWLTIFIRKLVIRQENVSTQYIDKCLDFFETIEEAEQALRFNVNRILLLEEIGLRIKEDLYDQTDWGKI